MLTVSSMEMPSRGYAIANTDFWFGNDPETGRERRVDLVAPMSYDGQPSQSYILDKGQNGILYPTKAKSKWRSEENYAYTVFNTVRCPHGRPLHGVYHASIDGAISSGGFPNTVPETWTCDGNSIEVFVYSNSSPRRAYCIGNVNVIKALACAEGLYRKGISGSCTHAEYAIVPYADYTEVRYGYINDYPSGRKPYTMSMWCTGFFTYNNQQKTYGNTAMGGSNSPNVFPFTWESRHDAVSRGINRNYSVHTPPTGNPALVPSGGELPSPEDLQRIIHEELELCSQQTGPTQVLTYLSDQWADACLQAVDSARFVKVNMIEFWKDIAETFAEVGAYEKFIKLCADYATDGSKKLLKKLRGLTKQASDTYLATYYGTRLTMSDLEEISNGTARYIWTYYSEHRKDARDLKGTNIVTYSIPDNLMADEATLRVNYQLNYNPYQGISEFNEIVHELGYAPDSYQIWEAIPLSFVVDWFVNVTDWLKANDLDNYMAKLQVNYEVKSYRLTADISRYMSEKYGWSCDLGYTLYSRLVSNVPTVHPAAITLAGEPQKHWLQGGALLVSKFL